MHCFRRCSKENLGELFTASSNVAIGGNEGVEESSVLSQLNVRLYDGDARTTFDNGRLVLTTHRIIWSDSPDNCIHLPLASVLHVRCEPGGGFSRSTPKLVLRLLPSHSALANAIERLGGASAQARWTLDFITTTGAIVSQETGDQIKLGFTRSGHKEFERALNETLAAKCWCLMHQVSPRASAPTTARSLGGGIGGIERQQALATEQADRSIGAAFADLGQLMNQAGQMVELSRQLAKKMTEAKSSTATGGNALSDDETAQWRSAMLSMGVVDTDTEVSGALSPDNATAVGSGGDFHTQLARQISGLLQPLLTGRGTGAAGGSSGCLDLASAFCRVNRSRGVQLISPEDLLRAGYLMPSLGLPVRLHRFDSGVMAFRLASEDESACVAATSQLVESRAPAGLSAMELVRLTNLPPLLAKERLLAAERAGLLCRDDSEQGLFFHCNLFCSRE